MESLISDSSMNSIPDEQQVESEEKVGGCGQQLTSVGVGSSN